MTEFPEIAAQSSQTSRRAFIQNSAIALAGAAAMQGRDAIAADAPAVATAAPSAEKKKIRIGVVGGSFGLAFQWHEHPDCIVAAVSDLRPERREALSKTYNCSTAYESLEELVKDKNVDAVAVFTGAPDHVRHAVACLHAGKHVISAVPAGMNLEECQLLLDTVRKTGLTYMMAETSYYHQAMISARKFLKAGNFGRIYSTEAEYHHPGLEALYFENGKRTWRHGLPPMLYPTHSTSFLVGLTNERLTQVSCLGWGNDSPILKDNAYNNPFWNETAFFKTNLGNAMRVQVWWSGALKGTERVSWNGDKMSFHNAHPHGLGPVIVRAGQQQEKDDAGFVRQLPEFENYNQPLWWKTDLLPEPLRHDTGHDGSHVFLTHEFISALTEGRKPAVDIYQALAYTVPGIVAHQSALKGGEQMAVPSFDPA